jgi:hypothetical protein
LAVALFLAAACDPATPRPSPPAPDKAQIYGDPALVPTREGEWARREVALAGELEGQLAVAPGVQRARVSVRSLPERPASIAVDVRVDPGADPAPIEARARKLGQLLLPGGEVDVAVHAGPPAPPPEDRNTPLLVLAVLGLGVSAGLAIERARVRRRSGQRLLR